MKKLISLLLVLTLLVGVLPMALATGTELPEQTTPPAPQPTTCTHENTTTTYEPNNDGTHWTVVTCTACGEKAAADSLDDCVANGSARECILCHANIPEDVETCEHPNAQDTATGKGDGTHVITTTCPACGATQTGEPVACEDKDADGKCDICTEELPEAPEV